MKLLRNFSKIKYNLFFSIAFTLCLLAPDYLLRAFTNYIKVKFDIREFLLLFIFSLSLSFLKRPRLLYITLLVFFIIETIQLHHVSFFGTYIPIYNISKVLTEVDEIATTGWGDIIHFYFILPIIAVCYGAAAYLFHWQQLKRTYLKYAPILVLGLILLFISGTLNYINKRGLGSLYPRPFQSSLYNSLNVFTYYIYSLLQPHKLARNNSETAYIPYKVTPLENVGTQNVVLVIGESCTPFHMSLYGYERETTPELQKLLKEGGGIYKRGISSAVSTRESLPLLINVVREPNSLPALTYKEVNLFKLAKQQGFKTFWISAQKKNLLSHLGAEYIDVIVTRQDWQHAELFKSKKDEALVEVAQKLPLGDKNFIVFHQRSLHSPYEDTYKHRPEFTHYPLSSALTRDEWWRNNYDNAMRYNDYVLSLIIRFARSSLKGESYVFITSDHGEMLGENGFYGHTLLMPEPASVPFILYALQGDKNFIQKVMKQDYITHYELGRMVANRLGFEIINPQEIAGEYYILNDIFRNCGSLKLKKDGRGRPTFFPPVQ